MYKVVIIDDEPIIVEGISKVVPWQKYGCQVVGTAGNGQEGLDVIRQCRPDIVFSDISMPGMDGLSMIAALRVEYPDMCISILTGFRDFDFAQKAIRLGVRRFLLKPSNMEEIVEALEAMVDSLNKRDAALGNGASKSEATETGAADDGAEEETEGTAGSFIVKNALRYIEEHYNQRISLSEVADKTYVSQWHLSKLLNGHTGKSFSELLNHVRIEKSKELLKNPSLRISDISEEVGFLDVAHFSRVFKKLEQVSPNEFRNCRI